MQHSKSMKFISFNRNLDNQYSNKGYDQMHLAAPQSNNFKNMLQLLRQGLENDLSKFCYKQTGEDSSKKCAIT